MRQMISGISSGLGWCSLFHSWPTVFDFRLFNKLLQIARHIVRPCYSIISFVVLAEAEKDRVDSHLEMRRSKRNTNERIGTGIDAEH